LARVHGPAAEEHPALVGALEQPEDAQQRRLAAAVGPDHAEDFARDHVERRNVEGIAVGIAAPDVAQAQDGRDCRRAHAGSTWIEPRWIENCQPRARSVSRVSYPRW